MNIYEKLTQIRVDLEQLRIVMTGKSKVHKYLELEDFLPTLIVLEYKLKIFSWISFGVEIATLTAINCEKPEEVIILTSPMSTAKLPNCHEVQNLGAVQKYLRRYLYKALYNIVERDDMEANLGNPAYAPAKATPQRKAAPKPKPAPKPAPQDDEHSLAMSQTQIAQLQTFAVEQYGQEEGGKAYKAALEALGVSKSSELNKTDFDAMKDALVEYQPLPFGFGD